jgi:hypothetical protein
LPEQQPPAPPSLRSAGTSVRNAFRIGNMPVQLVHDKHVHAPQAVRHGCAAPGRAQATHATEETVSPAQIAIKRVVDLHGGGRRSVLQQRVGLQGKSHINTHMSGVARAGWGQGRGWLPVSRRLAVHEPAWSSRGCKTRTGSRCCSPAQSEWGGSPWPDTAQGTGRVKHTTITMVKGLSGISRGEHHTRLLFAMSFP